MNAKTLFVHQSNFQDSDNESQKLANKTFDILTTTNLYCESPKLARNYAVRLEDGPLNHENQELMESYNSPWLNPHYQSDVPMCDYRSTEFSTQLTDADITHHRNDTDYAHHTHYLQNFITAKEPTIPQSFIYETPFFNEPTLDDLLPHQDMLFPQPPHYHQHHHHHHHHHHHNHHQPIPRPDIFEVSPNQETIPASRRRSKGCHSDGLSRSQSHSDSESQGQKSDSNLCQSRKPKVDYSLNFEFGHCGLENLKSHHPQLPNDTWWDAQLRILKWLNDVHRQVAIPSVGPMEDLI